jgi:2-isopropylmalate synthase
MATERLVIFDTTLRDGEQSPGCSMHLDEKLRMARQLDRLGVDIIEAGFPIASRGDFEAVQRIAREIRRPIITGLARAKREDVECAAKALVPAARSRIHVFLATSDLHLEHKLKIGRAEALDQAFSAVRLAKSLNDDVEFSPEDATRSDPYFLCRVLEAVIEAGATTVNIPDTVGYTLPQEYSALIQRIRSEVRGIEKATISVHCHDDLGLAVANSLAGVEAGARQIECTINGIGERAGNAALEELVMAMHVRADRLPFTTAVQTKEIYATSTLLSEIVRFSPQPNKAIVGRNAFAHEAGIHQHGMMTNPLCYEIMTPESVGVSETKLVLGKHSGRHALSRRLEELGHPLYGPELDLTYEQFTELADRKKNIYDQDLLSLVAQEDSKRLMKIASA